MNKIKLINGVSFQLFKKHMNLIILLNKVLQPNRIKAILYNNFFNCGDLHKPTLKNGA